jgi:hypothetical protein
MTPEPAGWLPATGIHPGGGLTCTMMTSPWLRIIRWDSEFRMLPW